MNSRGAPAYASVQHRSDPTPPHGCFFPNKPVGGIRAVWYALVCVMQESQAEGGMVRQGGPGSLRVTISSEGHAQAGDTGASSIKIASSCR